MDVAEFNGCRLYTGIKLDYRLRLWAAIASRAISAVAELIVVIMRWMRTLLIFRLSVYS